MHRLKNIVIILTFIVSLIVFSSCGSLAPTDVLVERGYNSGQIYIGAPMNQVANALGGYPPSWCVKQKITADGNLVLWDLATSGNLCGANLASSYALVFKNGYLIEIRQVTNQLDLQL